MELEVQVKLLEKQKAFLERQAFVADKKAILFDMMIDLAEKEYQIDIRKNSVSNNRPYQSKRTTNNSIYLLFIWDRQVYYRRIRRKIVKQDKTKQVVLIVDAIRKTMPRIGTRKLYYLLSDKLQLMKIGRDKFFDILRTNYLLIQLKRSYHITTNSHHRFRKHENLILDLEINRPEQVWV
ncbi:hypothetical protein [Flavobacterium sp.]|uniref:hypothetical protein n=1 Tax=Flavobacterium sp. TaxID=239 RepID=UPI001B5E414C|nr:hypothetical protein [Flavobacterium sp.]MBP6180842.1 hypothetical protein [Flavobacterium sp.]